MSSAHSNRATKLWPLIALLLVTVGENSVCPASSYAETKVLTAEGTYLMGDGETPSFAEAMALQKAKQMALEEAGTYVESYTKIRNYDLTTEEIQTIAGGVLEVEVLEKTRSLVGDGLRFYIKIKATVTTDKMEELAQRIKGKNIAKEYEQLRKDYARLSRELEALKALMAKTPPGPDREAALGEILEREKALTDLQKTETAFFKRLLGGETLAQAAREERTTVDRLIRTVREHGHLVEIGKPVAHIHKEAEVVDESLLSDKDKSGIEMIHGFQAIRKLVQTDEFQKATPQKKEQLLLGPLRQSLPEFAQMKVDEQRKFVQAWIGRLNEFYPFLAEVAMGGQAKLKVDIPLTVRLSETLLITLRSVADSLGGRLYSLPSQAGQAQLIKYLVPSDLYPALNFRVMDVKGIYGYEEAQSMKFQRLDEHDKKREEACANQSTLVEQFHSVIKQDVNWRKRPRNWQVQAALNFLEASDPEFAQLPTQTTQQRAIKKKIANDFLDAALKPTNAERGQRKEGKRRNSEDCDRWSTEYKRLVDKLDDAGNYYDRPFVATVLNLSPSASVDLYFHERVGKLGLVIRLLFQDGSQQTCKAPFVVNRILPVENYRFVTGAGVVREWNMFVSSLYDFSLERFTVQRLIQKENPDLHFLGLDFSDFYVVALANPVRFQVTFELPEQRVKELKGVEAELAEVENREDLAQEVCSTVLESW